MWNKVVTWLKGLGGTVAVSGGAAAFDVTVGIIVLVVLAVPVTIWCLYAMGRFARTDAINDLRLARAKTQAKEEFEAKGVGYCRDDVEERAQEIVFERAAAKQEKKARREHEAVLKDAEAPPEPAN